MFTFSSVLLVSYLFVYHWVVWCFFYQSFGWLVGWLPIWSVGYLFSFQYQWSSLCPVLTLQKLHVDDFFSTSKKSSGRAVNTRVSPFLALSWSRRDMYSAIHRSQSSGDGGPFVSSAPQQKRSPWWEVDVIVLVRRAINCFSQPYRGCHSDGAMFILGFSGRQCPSSSLSPPPSLPT